MGIQIGQISSLTAPKHHAPLGVVYVFQMQELIVFNVLITIILYQWGTHQIVEFAYHYVMLAIVGQHVYHAFFIITGMKIFFVEYAILLV